MSGIPRNRYRRGRRGDLDGYPSSWLDKLTQKVRLIAVVVGTIASVVSCSPSGTDTSSKLPASDVIAVCLQKADVSAILCRFDANSEEPSIELLGAQVEPGRRLAISHRRLIAFTSDSTIEIRSIGEQGLTEDREIIISEDAISLDFISDSKILYMPPGGRNAEVFDLESRKIISSTTLPLGEWSHLDVEPATGMLVMTSDTMEGAYLKGSVLDSEVEVTQTGDSGREYLGWPAIRPGSSLEVAFVVPHGLIIADISQGFSPVGELAESAVVTTPTWSPDGGQLAFVDSRVVIGLCDPAGVCRYIFDRTSSQDTEGFPFLPVWQ